MTEGGKDRTRHFPAYLASCYNTIAAEDHKEGAKFSSLNKTNQLI